MTRTEIVRIADQEAREEFAAVKQSSGFCPQSIIEHIDGGGIVDLVLTPTDLHGGDLDAYFDTAAATLRTLLMEVH